MDETQPLLSPELTRGHAIVTQDEAGYDHTIDFNPDGDPDNPLDWPQSYKRGVILLLAFMAFTV
jgi:hypothetical protein